MSRLYRHLFRLLLALAISAAVLSGIAGAHKSFLDPPAPSLADVLMHESIDMPGLSEEQKQQLQRSVKSIEGGERYLRRLHSTLWHIATFGFAGLAVGCLVCAALSYRAARDHRSTNRG